jgi:hypothetical protein
VTSPVATPWDTAPVNGAAADGLLASKPGGAEVLQFTTDSKKLTASKVFADLANRNVHCILRFSRTSLNAFYPTDAEAGDQMK